MAVEVERKFLLKNDDWRALAREKLPMRQGYLNDEVGCSIRVRTAGDQAWLNIKSVTIGARRLEYEYEIPLADGEDLLDSLARKPLIEKVRHFVDFAGHLWEIDEFAGDNAGLIVAEIELDHPDASYERPDWVGEEVTDDIRYYNTSLSKTPYKDWHANPSSDRDTQD
ncbi:CYTH domain-containing protein [Methylococcus sp. EFPC2]|uniref:CYTH domain-containing protein n=1 Tax=Methylococcus sp. EFPC2 TaxID=2812648 RepID=UPI001968A416|nr:CYTH domain-containing protein [Methylococcus sp. EFPC2]QSA98796.1 CYTH domain-containing protein [Methylococcus sp. EFPC2]